MWIFTRYVVWEVLKFFFAGLVVLTLLVTVGMGVKEGLSQGLPPIVMLRTMPFMIPEMLGITLPVAMLYSVCTVFGRMAGTNEIVALKSAGISPMAAVSPVLVMAVFLSLITVSIYEMVAVWCRPTVQRVVIESIEDIAYGMLQAKRSFQTDGLSITVKRVDGRRLIKPTIAITSRGNEPALTLSAEEAELRADFNERVLNIYCRNGEVDVEGQVRLSFHDTQKYAVPFREPEKQIHRNWLATGEIATHVRDLKESMDLAEERIDRCIADGETPSDSDLRQLKILQGRFHRLRTEPFRRWSNGFTCFFFVLVGAPVAMMRRNGDILATFFVCFLPILVAYYPLLMLSENLSTTGKLPPWSFWLGNAVMVVPGLVLLRQVLRH
ncbi:MAG: LptF/LptG family permease [Thermoguttaceae bacterium]|jgi:lipopolysaccharide export system permease protein|nr:LptF/LptG family permease [Thermoguttaceae bacterium]